MCSKNEIRVAIRVIHNYFLLLCFHCLLRTKYLHVGMEHDGLGISETCDRDKFIMSPTTGPGKVTWSNCSSKNLQDFIEYGTSELRSKKYPSQMLSKPTCLSEVVTKGKTSTTKQKLPGENYDAYFQCSLGLGPDFKPYFQRNKTPFNVSTAIQIRYFY